MEKLCKVGKEIQQIQDRAGLTDTELSSKLGVSRITLFRWKRGKTEIPYRQFMKIREICGAKKKMYSMVLKVGDQERHVRVETDEPDLLSDSAGAMIASVKSE